MIGIAVTGFVLVRLYYSLFEIAMRKKHIEPDSLPDGLRESHAIGKTTREWYVTRQMSSTLEDCGIFLCGWSAAGEGFNFIRPRFPMSQVLICISGMGEAWIDDEWQECGPGMAYLNPSHVFHAYRARPDLTPDNQPWVVYWATYHTPVVEGKKPVLLRADVGPVSDAIRNLYAEATGFGEQEALHRWAHLVDLCVRRIVQYPSGDPRLRRLWEDVLAGLDHPWSLSSLAQKVGISTEHLRRLCQNEVGCGPMEHVTHLRMQHAVALFASGHYSVTSVAERVGYMTPFAFSVAFKRVLGLPPSEYVATKLHPTTDAAVS